MLIFSRKEQQSFMIGDDIRVTVNRIAGGQVSIGIDAPRDVQVHRSEIYERIQRGDDRKARKD